MTSPHGMNEIGINTHENIDSKRGKASLLGDRIKSWLFSATKPIILLPESVRYGLLYNGGYISRKEIEIMLDTPGFQAIGLYLTLRYLQKTPQKRGCLEMICTYLYKTNGKSYKDINQICKSFLISREDDRMLANKLSYYSRIGFNTDEFFITALRENPLDRTTLPVIALYAGLLALPVLAKMYPGMPVIFCDPKSGLLLGYNVPYIGKLQEITVSDLQQYRSFAIIDDAVNSGETLQSIQNIIKKGAYQEPTFKHIIAMKKFTS